MEKITEERFKLVKAGYGLWDIIDEMDESQTEKIEKLVYSLLTEDQIDWLYFNLI